MSITLALIPLLAAQSGEPKPAALDTRAQEAHIAYLVASLSGDGDHAKAITELQSTGAAGVRWLAEHAATAEPDESSPGAILHWFEPRGDTVGADILPLLQHPDERARAWAALALANTMPPVVDLFVAEFQSKERSRKLAAVRAARAFVEHHERVAPALAPLVDDADSDVRRWATWSLSGLAPTSLPALFRALAHADERVRAIAAQGIQSSVYPYFTDRDSGEWDGYQTWHGLPPEMELRDLSNAIVARDGIAPLRKALSDTNEDVRYFAAMTLYEFAGDAAAARADLEPLTRDASPGVRFWANHALERIPATRWSRLERWASTLRKDAAMTRPLGDDELARLVADLDKPPQWSPIHDENCSWSDARDVRFEAAREITRRGLGALVADAQSAEAERIGKATRVLEAVERELDQRIAKLVRILDDEMGPGGPAQRALVELGPLAMPALEHELLRFPRFSMGEPTYVEIADVLAKIGEPALPALAIGLGHWREYGRDFSACTLLASGPAAVPLVRSIVAAWRSAGADVRIPGTDPRWDSLREPYWEELPGPSNVRAVRKLGPDAIPALVTALDDPHALVRKRAAVALGAFYSRANAALEPLARRLDDDQRWVALAAADAIVAIAPEFSAEARRAAQVRERK